jgi:hypothetical protein
MAVRKKKRRAANNGETEFEARLTPPEEKGAANKGEVDKSAANKNGDDKSAAGDGTLSVNTGDLKLPQEFVEEGTDGSLFHHIDPAVLVILCISLIFIASIAYVIWSGWEPSSK